MMMIQLLSNIIFYASHPISLTLFIFHKLYYYNNRNKLKLKLLPADNLPHQCKENYDTYHELLEIETSNYVCNINPISTLTWFKGDYNNAKSILYHRLNIIIEKNPWLQGRIVLEPRKKGIHQKSYLCYNNKNKNSNGDKNSNNVVNLEDYLETIDPNMSTITRDTPITDLSNNLQPLMIKNGPHEPVFKVCIVPCRKSPDRMFGLLFQMSHVVGDGATYYQLLRMLCSIDEQHVVKLNPERRLKLRKEQIAILGKEEEGHLTSKAWTLTYVIGLLWAKLMFKQTRRQFALVDMSKVKEAKILATKDGEVDFVSTNDVITSWFFNQTQCTTAKMAINWRNRLTGLTERNAGNYINIIFYQKEDYASPALIRKSLSKFRRVVTTKMPGFFSIFLQESAGATNWSNFASPNEIKGCEEDLHVPVAPTSHTSSFLSHLIIFRAGKGKLGVRYYLSRKASWDTNNFDSSLFLKDEPLK